MPLAKLKTDTDTHIKIRKYIYVYSIVQQQTSYNKPRVQFVIFTVPSVTYEQQQQLH